jgi:hypothetical protein
MSADSKSKQKANVYIATMVILITASIAIMIVHFATKSSEDSVQPSLQLQISPQLNSSLRAGPLKTEEPPTMSKKWNEGKPLDENSNRLQNIFDMMSSINY